MVQAPGIPRVALDSGSFRDGRQLVKYNKGDIIFASLYSSGRVGLPPPSRVQLEAKEKTSLQGSG